MTASRILRQTANYELIIIDDEYGVRNLETGIVEARGPQYPHALIGLYSLQEAYDDIVPDPQGFMKRRAEAFAQDPFSALGLNDGETLN